MHACIHIRKVFIIIKRCTNNAKRRHRYISEVSEQTEHWRDKLLFTNNGLPLQCFVSSEASDAPDVGVIVILLQFIIHHYYLLSRIITLFFLHRCRSRGIQFNFDYFHFFLIRSVVPGTYITEQVKSCSKVCQLNYT